MIIFVTNYIDFNFFAILLPIYRIHLLITLLPYWIALYLMLNLFAYTICNK